LTSREKPGTINIAPGNNPFLNHSPTNLMTPTNPLEAKSRQYRKLILTMIKEANTGHTGGSLSCVDILNVLYNRVMNVTPANCHHPDRDRYIHSKGHAVEALYAVLADKGFFPLEDLKSYSRYASPYVGHPTAKVNGIEHNTGGLGHGLSVAVGMALAGKLDGRSYRVFALLGDGELAEGSNWEAGMAAAHYNLDNLVVIIDRNGLQISGRTEDVNHLEPLVDKFRAFGFSVCQVDGHDLAALQAVFARLPFEPGRPSLVLAHTVKGKGISFIEDRVDWHHHVPTSEEFKTAMRELEPATSLSQEEE
jgi:transketolase